MKKTNPPATNFWFGFSLGIAGTTAVGYLLGTKKGRQTLRKLLDYAEETPHDLNHILEKLGKIYPHLAPEKKTSQDKPIISTLDQIIHKIRNNSHQENKHKKLFVKENKNNA
jgi:hypothetical protein